MSGTLLATIAIALYGWTPAAARSAQLTQFARRGPNLSALLLTGMSGGPHGGELSTWRRLIQVTPDDDPQKPEFWFRLGAACAAYWDHTPPDAPPAERRRAEALFAEGVAAFRAALAFEGYSRIDGALFALARLHLAAGDGDGARPYIDRLARYHPRPGLVARAYALYADHLFDRGELAAALAWYSALDQLGDPQTRPYALYRKGWCFVRRGDTEAARAAFDDAVHAAEKADRSTLGQVTGREAARDLAQVF